MPSPVIAARMSSVSGRPATASAASTALASLPTRLTRASQQLRQPVRQPGRRAQRVPDRAGQRRSHQLLGEKRVTLGADVQIIGEPVRRLPAHQAGDLLRRLAP